MWQAVMDDLLAIGMNKAKKACFSSQNAFMHICAGHA